MVLALALILILILILILVPIHSVGLLRFDGHGITERIETAYEPAPKKI
jgi:hypothetical protein